MDGKSVDMKKVCFYANVNLAKIKKIGVSSGKKVFGFPISNHDEEKNIVIYQK